jgi:hypothetical protein
VIHYARVVEPFVDAQTTLALSRFLIHDQLATPEFRPYLDKLWEAVFDLPHTLKVETEGHFIDSLKSLLRSHDDLDAVYIYTGKQLLQLVESKYEFLQALLFDREIVYKSIESEMPLRFFAELALSGGMNTHRLFLGEHELSQPTADHLWVLTELLSIEYFNSIHDLKMKEQLMIFMQSELVPLTLEITRTEHKHLMYTLVTELIGRAEQHRLYSKVLFNLLKNLIYGKEEIPTGLE